MHDFIKAVVPEPETELRWLYARVFDEDKLQWHRAIWVITTDRDVFECVPKLIRLLFEQFPMVHPRKIIYSTHTPGEELHDHFEVRNDRAVLIG